MLLSITKFATKSQKSHDKKNRESLTEYGWVNFYNSGSMTAMTAFYISKDAQLFSGHIIFYCQKQNSQQKVINLHEITKVRNTPNKKKPAITQVLSCRLAPQLIKFKWLEYENSSSYKYENNLSYDATLPHTIFVFINSNSMARVKLESFEFLLFINRTSELRSTIHR